MLRSISILLFATVLTPATMLAQSGERSIVSGAVSSAVQESTVQSARLPRDRHYLALLTSARRQLKAGNVTATIDTLQQILNADKDSFVLVEGGHYVTVKAEADRLIGALRPAQRKLYEQQVGPAARRALTAARTTGGTAPLIDVVLRYRGTSTGFTALHALAAELFDRGKFLLAASAYRSVFDHPLADRGAKQAAIVRLVVALSRSGRSEEAAFLIDEQASLLSTQPAMVGGRPAMLVRWLREQVHDSLREANLATAGTTSTLIGATPLTNMGASSAAPVWRWESQLPNGIAKLARQALDDTAAQGIPQLLSFTPMVAGDVAVVREIDHVTAINLSSGKVLWRQQAGSQVVGLAGNIKMLENDAFRSMISRGLVRRLLSDSLLAMMSSDGRRIFVVADEAGRKSGKAKTLSVQAGGTSPPSTRLRAIDLASGRTHWVISGNELRGEKVSQIVPDIDWLGPPLPLGNALYAVGRVGMELRMIVLAAADGRLLWQLPLADLPSEKQGARKLRRDACPIAFSGELLICPTAAGAVVAVDPVSRRAVWAYRYQRDDIRSATGLPPGGFTRNSEARWWRGWRVPAVVIESDRVLVVSPESDALHALDLHSGKCLWRIPRRLGLFLAGADDQQAIVVERYQVRSVDLKSGTTRWLAPVGRPSGRGILTATHYMQPLDVGGVAMIRLDDGTIRRTFPDETAAFGNFSLIDSTRVIAQAFDRVVLLRGLAGVRQDARDRLRDKPNDRDLLRQRGLLAREAGDFAAAQKIFRALHANGDKRSRDELRKTLTVAVRNDPGHIDTLRPQLEELLDTTEQRLDYFYGLAHGYRKSARPLEALNAYLRLLDFNPGGRRSTADGPERRVRFDRLLQGEIANLFAAANTAGRRSLHEVMDRRLKQALASPDPFAVQRFSDQFSRLPWGRQVRARLASKSVIGIGFLKSQLMLMELTGRGQFLMKEPQRRTATRALLELATFVESRSYRSEAAAAYRRLHDEFADVRLHDGRTPAETIAALPENSPLATEIESGHPDPWPVVTPSIDIQKQRKPPASFTRIPVEAHPGSLYQRLGILIDGGGKTIRFQSDRERGFWELSLPKSNRPFRTALPLHRGWGVGHLLVLKIGTELFGVTALNKRGDRRAEVLWRIDMLEGRGIDWNRLTVHIRPGRPGFRVVSPAVVDEFGRELGQVGPVCPGYLCYHNRGRLIAVETATAARLWERNDLFPATISGGDDEFVLLYRPDSRQLEVLRTVDGKTTANRQLRVLPREFLRQQGRYALISEKHAAQQSVKQVDLVTGQSLWQRMFPVDSRLFAIDDRLLGVLEPAGGLYVLSLRTGETLREHRLDVPDRLTQIYCVSDERSFSVVLSRPFSDQNHFRLNRDRGMFRRALVNGTLYGFDHLTAQLRWKTALTDGSFDLDQPREVPFLVFRQWRAEPGDLTRSRLMLLCIDKRTGKTVSVAGESGPQPTGGAYTLETNIDQGWVDLKTEQQTVRFDFRQ